MHSGEPIRHAMPSSSFCLKLGSIKPWRIGKEIRFDRSIFRKMIDRIMH
jgi:hypothetical protein